MINFKNSTITFLIAYSPLVIVPIFVIIVTIFSIIGNEQKLTDTISTSKSYFIDNKKRVVEDDVLKIKELVEYQHIVLEKKIKIRVKDRVDSTIKIADTLYHKFEKTMSKKELNSLISETLRPLLWNDGKSFIWIIDYEGNFILGPEYLKHLEGTSIINYQDMGRYPIKEEIEITKDGGSGYIKDKFTKPGGIKGKFYDQIVFVKSLKHHDLYFGSAEYIDEAYKIIDAEVIELIRVANNTHGKDMFILGIDGTAILTSTVQETDIKDSKIIINRVKNTLNKRKSAYLTYKWYNPRNLMVEEKTIFTTTANDGKWIIAEGFYKSDVEILAKNKATEYYEQYRTKIEEILISGLVLFVISLICTFILGKFITKKFNEYTNIITAHEIELEVANSTLEQEVANRTSELREANEKLLERANIDELTNIRNRRAINESLEEELIRFERNKIIFSVILFDIDFFKKINDEYGHSIGDDVLQLLATGISGNIRKTDKFGRYGGEEFLLVLPGTDLDKAVEFAEKLRYKISNWNFNIPTPVTVSMGVVESKDGLDSKALVSIADELMYKSKELGRNKVSS